MHPALVLAIAVAVAGSGLLLAGDNQFVGEKKCKACHMKEYKVWQASDHSKAFDSLKPEEQTKADCLACHNTGHGKAAAAGAALNGVQCESCHGPGSAYKSMKVMSKKAYKENPEAAHKGSVAAGLLVPNEETCKSCHNEKSPTFKGFDYASAMEKIKHWK